MCERSGCLKLHSLLELLHRAIGPVHFVGMEFIPFIECSNTIQESRRLGTYCAYMCQITKYRLYMARADGTQLLYCIPFAGLKSGVTTCIIPTELQSHWLGTYDDKAIQLVRAIGSVHFVGMEFIPFIE